VIGCYPGSFNPATIAHVAIAEAAWQQCGLDRVDLILSEQTLGKLDVVGPTVEERAESLRSVLKDRPWIGVAITTSQLLAEIAASYDVLVMGADKWQQITELQWYESDEHRQRSLGSLPRLAIAPRPPHDIPDHATTLTVSRQLWGISSTGVRNGRSDWRA
jgi:nicotinic acid mononucleotide adenylyltransferase